MLSFELIVKIVDFGIELLVKRLLEDVNLGFSEGLSFFFLVLETNRWIRFWCFIWCIVNGCWR